MIRFRSTATVLRAATVLCAATVLRTATVLGATRPSKRRGYFFINQFAESGA